VCFLSNGRAAESCFRPLPFYSAIGDIGTGDTTSLLSIWGSTVAGGAFCAVEKSPIPGSATLTIN